MKRLGRILPVFLAISGLLPGARAHANIDLVFSPNATTVNVNDVIEVELYAVSDSDVGQRFSFVDALLYWDETRLELLGHDPAFCFNATFFLCGFLPDPDDLNDGSGSPNLPVNDGDALYTALSNADPDLRPTAPPPPGLLVTTFQFRAIAPANDTVLFLQPQFDGGFARTRVFEVGNVDVTGDISDGIIHVKICSTDGPDGDGDGVGDDCDACPGFNDAVDFDEDGLPDACDPCPFLPDTGVLEGDVNDDGEIDPADISPFIDVLLGTDTDPEHILRSDLNCDSAANGLDIQPFVDLLLI